MPPRISMSLLLALGLLTGCGGAAPPSNGATSGDTPERLASTTRTGADVLGPAGWRGLNLRMSAPRAIATGLLGRRTGPPTPCQQWSTIRSSAVGSLFISQRLGVAALAGAPGTVVYTPEGMRIGWNLDQVTKTYPNISSTIQGGNLRFVPVPGNTKARYRVGFDAAGHVSALSLELVDQDCYD